MLYDNAQLARVYLHGYQITGEEFYSASRSRFSITSRGEMVAPNGGFYSTRDSDSEGHEGEFFVWMPDEIRSVLGGSASAFCLPKPVTEAEEFAAQLDG